MKKIGIIDVDGSLVDEIEYKTNSRVFKLIRLGNFDEIWIMTARHFTFMRAKLHNRRYINSGLLFKIVETCQSHKIWIDGISLPYDVINGMPPGSFFESEFLPVEKVLFSGNKVKWDDIISPELEEQCKQFVKEDKKVQQFNGIYALMRSTYPKEDIHYSIIEDTTANLVAIQEYINTNISIDEKVKFSLIDVNKLIDEEHFTKSDGKKYTKALLILHNSELNGANKVALNFLQMFKEFEWAIISRDGDIDKSTFSNNNSVRIVQHSSICPTFFNEFDFIVCNTLQNLDWVGKINNYAQKDIMLVVHECYDFEEKAITNTNGYFEAFNANLELCYYAFQSVNNLVFVSNHQREIYDTFIEKGRTHVIHNGINISDWKERLSRVNRNEIRGDFGFNSTESVIITVGSICPRKNQMDIVEIARRTPSQIKFLIVGARNSRDYEINYIKEIRRLIKKYQLEKRVYLISAKKDIEEYYAIADIALFVSKNEAFPLSILEAMYCGIPIVTSDIESALEAVDNQTGFSYPLLKLDSFSNSLKLLHENPKLRKNMGAKARDRVINEFNLEIMTKKYRSLINL